MNLEDIRDRTLKERLITALSREKIDEEEIFAIIPKLQELKNKTQENPAHFENVWDHTLRVINGIPKSNTFLRTVALFHDTGKIKSGRIINGVERFWGHEAESVNYTRPILAELGFGKTETDKILRLIEIHDTIIEPTKEGVKSIVDEIGTKMFEQLMMHKKADLLAHAEWYQEEKKIFLDEIERIYNELYERKIR